jgi:hypothetical protein
VRDHLLVGALSGRVARSEQGELDARVPGDLALDRGADQAPDRDRLTDGTDPVPLRVDEDDEVLDEAVQPASMRTSSARARRRSPLSSRLASSWAPP